MKWRILIIILSAILLPGVSSPLLAKEGLYFGGAAIYNRVGDRDFNGQSTSVAGNETFIQPDIEDGFGLGLLGGYIFKDLIALEMNFMFSDHDAQFRGESFGVFYGALNFDLKYYFETTRQEEPVFPYLMVGIGFHSLDVERALTNASGVIRDGSYSGIALNLGVGADHYVTPDVSITTGAVYRIVRYDEVEGADEVLHDINGSLNGDGFGLVLSVARHF